MRYFVLSPSREQRLKQEASSCLLEAYHDQLSPPTTITALAPSSLNNKESEQIDSIPFTMSSSSNKTMMGQVQQEQPLPLSHSKNHIEIQKLTSSPSATVKVMKSNSLFLGNLRSSYSLIVVSFFFLSVLLLSIPRIGLIHL